MNEIDLAYLPIIGRGEQINILCAMHKIKVNYLLSSPMGQDFDKDTEAPFGTIPWMKDHLNGLELNDSMAIIQYLIYQYPGPLTPENNEVAASTFKNTTGDIFFLIIGWLRFFFAHNQKSSYVSSFIFYIFL